jgi:Xaa-Pro dipeptidase
VGLQAENLTIELMRPGTRLGEVARKVHAWIADQGYGDTILYGPAHGVGNTEHEYPVAEKSSELIVQENMTFEVDMYLAKPDMGYRWQDPIVIRAEGAEVLTSFPREVTIL